MNYFLNFLFLLFLLVSFNSDIYVTETFITESMSCMKKKKIKIQSDSTYPYL